MITLKLWFIIDSRFRGNDMEVIISNQLGGAMCKGGVGEISRRASI